MRGSKPGRSPYCALTWVAYRSMMDPSPVELTEVAVPSGMARFFSPGSISGLLRNGSGFGPMPPSIVIGPRISLIRLFIGGKTSASCPSTTLLGTAWTVTCWMVLQFVGVKTSCGETDAPPLLSGETATAAETAAPSTRSTVIARPWTSTS